MKKISMLMASLLLLAACSNDEASQTETEKPEKQEQQEQVAAAQQQEMTEEGFITQVTQDQILVNNIYFTVKDDVSVQFDDGKKTTDGEIRDIRTGMKVSVDYKGPLANAFPMEGEADAVTILNDEESAAQAESLQAFIKSEELASLLMLGQPIIYENEIGFLFNNMETGDLSEVRINLETHEYTIGGE